ncbi:sensor histidine kinase [Solirhodobacter olei]|uniref:sensor histidine kinase n=1 Tax=Solirhodobacter olei TaxID=2493082 RepID=UPI000FDA0552|nr:HAMP domain-containing sensor histidine kinase [Solirhodobacter olei]
MSFTLINSTDPPKRQIEKLTQIAEVLMNRVEQATDASGAAYAQFQRAALLEEQVRDRTRDLERTLDLLNQSNAQLERAGAARARFVAAASHDLLQPLSAVKLFLAQVAEDPIPEASRATVEKAQNALESVGQILTALLDISRLESGRAEVEMRPVELHPLMAQLSDEFAPLAAAKGLDFRLIPARAEVASDPTYLRRILQNLIGNAVRYTERGRVLVGARHIGRALRIEVHDTGPGIPAHEQANVFKEFHRLNAPASAAEGMGLGLAIVERACALLGHRLTLSSSPGDGTCFAVSLGLARPDTRSARQPPAPRDRIVLLVKRDDRRRLALGQMLERLGVSVLDARSGDEALALIDEIGIAPDAVLTGSGEEETVARLHARHGAIPARVLPATMGARDETDLAAVLAELWPE